ncbi:unnamed protein product [Sphenostylis stenocarpa]|uniref:DCD domain-containing protein n=1 Tax=Sphenostylis stenocarpa TaxID=92480 RepID=A0AA86VJ36_9FABA|nr:unnamed protein product [Sphenostylis stenocarpa]
MAIFGGMQLQLSWLPVLQLLSLLGVVEAADMFLFLGEEKMVEFCEEGCGVAEWLMGGIIRTGLSISSVEASHFVLLGRHCTVTLVSMCGQHRKYTYNNFHYFPSSTMGTSNPAEVSSNPMSLVKDDMMSTDYPPSLGKDDEMCVENPPDLSSNSPPLGKDGMMSIVNPIEEFSNPVSPRKDVMVDNVESCHNVNEKQIRDFSELKETKDEAPKGKGEEVENKMKESQNRSTIDKSPKEDSDSSPLKAINPPEGSRKAELSDKNTPQSLKAKSKIVKKSHVGILKAKKNNDTQQKRGKRRISSSKKLVDNAESCHNANEKQISNCSQLKEANNEPPKGKSQEVQNIVKENQNKSTNGKSRREKSEQARKDKNSQLDKTEQKQESEEKHRELSKGSNGRKNKGKRSGMARSQLKDEKGEKLGGFIFMCSAKTKPDCFRYRVMGVSAGKKDDVLQIKPGLKLFLYDFDLKLLYGIYKASSSGGMKLEPKAFGGKFPAQVRFKIVADCFPLPENIFKKAIKDNYNEKSKFRTELSIRQVRKLTQLFRPLGIHSDMHPIHSQPKVIIREREAPDDVRGSRSRLHRENYDVEFLYRDNQFDQPQEIAHDMSRMENYQAYGLPRDRRNVATTTSHVKPTLESYEGDYQPHHMDLGHLRNVPSQVQSVRTDPLYFNDSRGPPYLNDNRGPPYLNNNRDPPYLNDNRDSPYLIDNRDPYDAYPHGLSHRDAYLAPLSREEISANSPLVRARSFVEMDNLPRREVVQGRHYPIYSALDHLRVRPYHEDRLEALPAPILSRYSFAGPSFRRR